MPRTTRIHEYTKSGIALFYITVTKISFFKIHTYLGRYPKWILCSSSICHLLLFFIFACNYVVILWALLSFVIAPASSYALSSYALSDRRSACTTVTFCGAEIHCVRGNFRVHASSPPIFWCRCARYNLTVSREIGRQCRRNARKRLLQQMRSSLRSPQTLTKADIRLLKH